MTVKRQNKKILIIAFLVVEAIILIGLLIIIAVTGGFSERPDAVAENTLGWEKVVNVVKNQPVAETTDNKAGSENVLSDVADAVTKTDESELALILSEDDFNELMENVDADHNSVSVSVEANDVSGLEELSGNITVPLGTPEDSPEYILTKAKLDSMTPGEKVAQLFVTTPEAHVQTDKVFIAGNMTRNAVNNYPVGGLVYSSKNFESMEQTADLLDGVSEMMVERVDIPAWLFAAATINADYSVIVAGDNEALTKAMDVNYDINSDGNELLIVPVYPGVEADYTADSEIAKYAFVSDASDLVFDGAGEASYISENAYEMIRVEGFDNILIAGISTEGTVGISGEGRAVTAINAGADMVYVSSGFVSVYNEVVSAVNEGLITEERLDEAVLNILLMKELY